MKVNISFEPEDPTDFSILEEIFKKLGHGDYEVSGGFYLTGVFKEILKAHPNKWFYAAQIANTVEQDPELALKALKYYGTNFKAGIAQGISGSSKTGENEGWLEVDRSEGWGWHQYKWKGVT